MKLDLLGRGRQGAPGLLELDHAHVHDRALRRRPSSPTARAASALTRWSHGGQAPVSLPPGGSCSPPSSPRRPRPSSWPRCSSRSPSCAAPPIANTAWLRSSALAASAARDRAWLASRAASPPGGAALAIASSALGLVGGAAAGASTSRSSTAADALSWRSARGLYGAADAASRGSTGSHRGRSGSARDPVAASTASLAAPRDVARCADVATPRPHGRRRPRWSSSSSRAPTSRGGAARSPWSSARRCFSRPSINDLGVASGAFATGYLDRRRPRRVRRRHRDHAERPLRRRGPRARTTHRGAADAHARAPTLVRGAPRGAGGARQEGAARGRRRARGRHRARGAQPARDHRERRRRPAQAGDLARGPRDAPRDPRRGDEPPESPRDRSSPLRAPRQRPAIAPGAARTCSSGRWRSRTRTQDDSHGAPGRGARGPHSGATRTSCGRSSTT